MGKNISDADRKMVKKILSADAKTISDADREMVKKILSDEQFIKRNDGGIARKTRTF